MLKTCWIVILIVFLIDLTLHKAHGAQDMDQDQKIEAISKKSPVLAGGLAAFVGFGTGHWYANGKWTARSTLFLVLDAVAFGLMIGIPQIGPDYEGHHVPYHYYIPALLFTAEKTWQIFDAVGAANRTNSFASAGGAALRGPRINLLTLTF